MKSNERRWSTSDEIAYLDGIGTHQGRFDPIRHNVSRQEKTRLLRGALLGYSRRTRWDGLDPEVVRRHAEFLLATFAGLHVDAGAEVTHTAARSGGQI